MAKARTAPAEKKATAKKADTEYASKQEERRARWRVTETPAQRGEPGEVAEA